jgi:hypothetical protein
MDVSDNLLQRTKETQDELTAQSGGFGTHSVEVSGDDKDTTSENVTRPRQNVAAWDAMIAEIEAAK